MFSFSYLFTVARTSNIIKQKWWKWAFLSFPEFSRKAQLFTTGYYVSCGFVIIGLYYVEIYSHFDESFYHEQKLKFVKCFYVSFERIMWLSFLLLMCFITLIDLHMLNHLSLWPFVNKPNLTVVHDPFYTLLHSD